MKTYGTIRLAFGDSAEPTAVEIGARIVGPFGIHSHRFLNMWCITHVTTGRSVSQGHLTEADAVGVAEKLQQIEGADWSFDTPEAINAWPREVRQQVRRLISVLDEDEVDVEVGG